MALLSSTVPLLLLPIRRYSPKPNPLFSSTVRTEALPRPLILSSDVGALQKRRGLRGGVGLAESHICEKERAAFDRSSLSLEEAVSDDELWAAVRLRVRTFYKFNDSYGIEVAVVKRMCSVIKKTKTSLSE